MATTLVEMMKGEASPFRKGVIATFIENNRLAQVLPYDNIEGSHEGILQEAVLPEVSTRAVNEAWTASEGRWTEVVQGLRIYGGDIGIDPFISATRGPSAAARHIALKIKAVSNRWLLDFFKGDTLTSPRDMDGLQSRLSGYNSISVSGASGGGPLSLIQLDEAIAKCYGAKYLLMGRKMHLRLSQAARATGATGYITRDVDELGNQVMRYNGLEVIRVVDNADNDNILGFTEVGTGGGTTASSIYVIGVGDNGVRGIQNSRGMDVRNIGESNTTPLENTRVEWYQNFQVMHPRSAIRLRDISDAPFTI